MRILFALLSLGVGTLLLAGGYRLARFVIPLWGFLAGLSVGGSIIANMQDTPFLGTTVGLLVGTLLGLIFGVFAYLYYSVAVVVLVGAAGYWAGSSFVQLFGLDPGVLSVMVGTSLGIALGIIALVMNAPKYFLIVITSLAGAMAAVGGILLLFNQIPLESFSLAAVNYSLSNSFIWTLVALVMAIAGMIFQTRTTAHYGFEAWALGEHDDNERFRPPSSPPAGAHRA